MTQKYLKYKIITLLNKILLKWNFMTEKLRNPKVSKSGELKLNHNLHIKKSNIPEMSSIELSSLTSH